MASPPTTSAPKNEPPAGRAERAPVSPAKGPPTAQAQGPPASSGPPVAQAQGPLPGTSGAPPNMDGTDTVMDKQQLADEQLLAELRPHLQDLGARTGAQGTPQPVSGGGQGVRDVMALDDEELMSEIERINDGLGPRKRGRPTKDKEHMVKRQKLLLMELARRNKIPVKPRVSKAAQGQQSPSGGALPLSTTGQAPVARKQRAYPAPSAAIQQTLNSVHTLGAAVQALTAAFNAGAVTDRDVTQAVNMAPHESSKQSPVQAPGPRPASQGQMRPRKEAGGPGKEPEKGSGKGPGKGPRQGPEKGAGHRPERGPEKAPEKGNEQAPDKGPVKGPVEASKVATRDPDARTAATPAVGWRGLSDEALLKELEEVAKVAMSVRRGRPSLDVTAKRERYHLLYTTALSRGLDVSGFQRYSSASKSSKHSSPQIGPGHTPHSEKETVQPSGLSGSPAKSPPGHLPARPAARAAATAAAEPIRKTSHTLHKGNGTSSLPQDPHAAGSRAPAPPTAPSPAPGSDGHVARETPARPAASKTVTANPLQPGHRAQAKQNKPVDLQAPPKGPQKTLQGPATAPLVEQPTTADTDMLVEEQNLGDDNGTAQLDAVLLDGMMDVCNPVDDLPDSAQLPELPDRHLALTPTAGTTANGAQEQGQANGSSAAPVEPSAMSEEPVYPIDAAIQEYKQCLADMFHANQQLTEVVRPTLMTLLQDLSHAESDRYNQCVTILSDAGLPTPLDLVSAQQSHEDAVNQLRQEAAVQFDRIAAGGIRRDAILEEQLQLLLDMQQFARTSLALDQIWEGVRDVVLVGGAVRGKELGNRVLAKLNTQQRSKLLHHLAAVRELISEEGV